MNFRLSFSGTSVILNILAFTLIVFVRNSTSTERVIREETESKILQDKIKQILLLQNRNFDATKDDVTRKKNEAVFLALKFSGFEDQIPKMSASISGSQKAFLEEDPDAKRDMIELISSQGYPVEKHIVITEDGYILALHRIPHGRQGDIPTSATTSATSNNTTTTTKYPNATTSTTKPVVYLQHGLLSTACDWVLNFNDDSLGFILADHGYDVWMGDSRGNTYSRDHVNLSVDDEKYWDFSFDEMAKYDMTAFVDYVLAKTGQHSLHYVGHSQGTVMAFALFASRPEYQKKIRLFVALAPLVQLNSIRSPIKYFFFPDEIMYFMLGRKSFLPNTAAVQFLADHFCDKRLAKWLCYNVYFLICGYDVVNFNQTRLPVYVNHSPAGSSVKAVVHFSQIYHSGQFAMYDFGSGSANMKNYNQTSPPIYDLARITTPLILFSGQEDWLADPPDVSFLESKLPNIRAKYVIPKWNHLDFVWGMNAANKCYAKILEWLPRF